MNAFPDHWLERLKASAAQAPLNPRHPLLLGAKDIGSLDDGYFRRLCAEQAPVFSPLLARSDGAAPSWRLLGDPAQALQRLAQALRATPSSGVASQWRDELLVVHDADGAVVGRVERGAVRALGIQTRAVHLVGADESGRTWVQQRSRSKATDPGLWDTLMGGMISAADTLESALERETWEEAGIRLESLTELRWRGHVQVSKPNACDGGIGHVFERIDWFACVTPPGVIPENRDGEVEQFCLVDLPELRRMLASDSFTTEAALILVQHLRERQGAAAAPGT